MRSASDRKMALFALVFGLLASAGISQGPPPPPPPPPPLAPVPVPPQNQLTEAKRVLGKILFWDEQMSSDNTVSCGTCHRPETGGTDPRVAINPGQDGVFGTNDDVRGSPGVSHSDQAGDFVPDTIFGVLPQVGTRRAPDFTGGLYSPNQFWDGRAGSTFVDPETNLVSIPQGGSLESQSVGPILSSSEMAHDGRTWQDVRSKLEVAHPLRLATNIPPDMAAAIQANATYPLLFQAAFGSPLITAQRIAFAIATYERTLVPNQTPWDAFRNGNQAALTQNQIQGLNLFSTTARCAVCHAPPVFSDSTFRNIGLRPVAEDIGRQAVTNNINDRGRFKVPSLRNVALRPRFFHNGEHNTLLAAVGEYNNSGGPFPDNRDPVLNGLTFTPQELAQIVDFLTALTDPRVPAHQFPFDRPTLYSERVTPPSTRFGPATAGSGGIAPQIIAQAPLALGLDTFRVGIAAGLGGADAYFAFTLQQEVPALNLGGLRLNVDPISAIIVPFTLHGAGNGGGYQTVRTALPVIPALVGVDLFTQWIVSDPQGPSGFSATQGARFTMF